MQKRAFESVSGISWVTQYPATVSRGFCFLPHRTGAFSFLTPFTRCFGSAETWLPVFQAVEIGSRSQPVASASPTKYLLVLDNNGKIECGFLEALGHGIQVLAFSSLQGLRRLVGKAQIRECE